VTTPGEKYTPSLLEDESRGGDTNERGKEFEAAVILSYIPRWMAMEGFTSMLREGMGDVEAKFFTPGRGFTREFVEVKDHSVPPAEFWREIDRFRQLDGGSPGEYQWFTLASGGLSESLRPLLNSLRRIRGPYGFYRDDSSIVDNSYRNYAQTVLKLGRTEEDADFLYTKVMLQDDLSPHHPYAKALFIEELKDHHPFYCSLSGNVLDDIYAHLSAFVRSRRNRTITGNELEEKLLEKVPVNLQPPIQPVRIHTIGSDEDPGVDARKLCFEWGSFFGGEARHYPPAEVWNERVLGDLRSTRSWIREARRTRRIALSGSRRLSASLAIGFIFSAVSGFSVEMMYRGQVWATDAHPNGSTPAYPFIQAGSSEDVRGERLVVSIGIIRDIAEEVEGDLGRHGLAGMPVLHLKGREPIVSPEQANLAAGEIKGLIARALHRTGARRVDLFFAGPAFLALFLGHRFNATAPVQCYEYVESGYFLPTCELRPS
jgi:SMODS-associated and fused to various effectors sensor domain